MHDMSVRTILVAALVSSAACNESHAADGGTDGGGDFTSCSMSSSCIVIPASCCGACGAATREDSIAVNASRASAYQASVCPKSPACPACYMEQDPTLVATCASGRCAIVDVLEQPFAACTDDAECRLRSRDCCECGGDVTSAGLISIRTDGEGAYMDIVCDEGSSTPCPECAPVYPPEAAAACDVAEGHCRVLWSR
jgi:hypothetical protein